MSLEEPTRRTLPTKILIPMCKGIIKELLPGLDFPHRECDIVHIGMGHRVFRWSKANLA